MKSSGEVFENVLKTYNNSLKSSGKVFEKNVGKTLKCPCKFWRSNWKWLEALLSPWIGLEMLWKRPLTFWKTKHSLDVWNTLKSPWCVLESPLEMLGISKIPWRSLEGKVFETVCSVWKQLLTLLGNPIIRCFDDCPLHFLWHVLFPYFLSLTFKTDVQCLRITNPLKYPTIVIFLPSHKPVNSRFYWIASNSWITLPTLLADACLDTLGRLGQFQTNIWSNHPSICFASIYLSLQPSIPPVFATEEAHTSPSCALFFYTRYIFSPFIDSIYHPWGVETQTGISGCIKLFWPVISDLIDCCFYGFHLHGNPMQYLCFSLPIFLLACFLACVEGILINGILFIFHLSLVNYNFVFF